MLEIFVTAHSHVGRYTRSVRSKIPDYIDVVIHDGARQLLPLVTSPGVPGLFRISRYARGYRAYFFLAGFLSLSLMRIKREREAPSCAVFISGALKAVRERERANGCKLHATKNNRLTPVRRFSRAANFSCISLPSFPPY